jgi:hypothetical protein
MRAFRSPSAHTSLNRRRTEEIGADALIDQAGGAATR